MNSSFRGKEFIQAWRTSRSVASLKIISGFTDFSTKQEILVPSSTSLREVEKLVKDLYIRRSELQPRDFEAIEVLRCKYEATHCFRMSYSDDGRKLCEATVPDSTYTLFSLLLCDLILRELRDEKAHLARVLQLWNCSLKLNDKLVGLKISLDKSTRQLAAEAISKESEVFALLVRRFDVRL